MEKITIVRTRKIAENVFITSLDYQPDFVPGQVIEITEDPELPTRMYSICSAPGYKTLDILYDLRELGRLTPKLCASRKGDELFVSSPAGTFTCKENEKAVWIAGGTGIAPFASMFFAGNTNNKLLIHGGRTLESFYFQKNFLPVLGDNYTRCCTTEGGDGIYIGRLTNWLKSQKAFPGDHSYYICGNSEMVVQSRDILLEKGVNFDSIVSEIYF